MNIMMSSMVLSSPLSGLSHSKLIVTNSKNSSSSSKALGIDFSNKISLEFSLKSSFIHGDFTFPSPNLSKFVAKSPSSNIITSQTNPSEGPVIYDFQAKENKSGFSLSRFKRKVVLIVNVPEQGSVRTEPQFKLLHYLYDNYKSRGFEIAAFLYDKSETDSEADKAYPQKASSGDPLQIKDAKFGIFDRVKVNDPKAHPLFVHLRSKFGMGKAITTEFHKFLVNRDGLPYKSFALDTPQGVIEKEVDRLLSEDAD